MNVYEKYLSGDEPDMEQRVALIREAIRASFERSADQPNHEFNVVEMRRFSPS